jgi:tRNA pseudouridine13 synthase
MPLDLAPRPLLLLTNDIPGTGGVAKVSPEDFVVEELPAYLPTGEGEHLYLFVEKRDLSTSDAVRLLTTALSVSERDAGYAGQKDRRAVTRQWISIHTKATAVESPDPRIRILQTNRHGNKLRLGHSKGNRFTIALRGVRPDALKDAEAIVARLSAEGLPNYYGEQRFGRRGDNALLGAAVLGLAEHPQMGRAKRDRFLRRLAISALQSELFNRCLTARLKDGLWNEVVPGDILRKRASGGVFVCAEPEIDRPRLHSGEIDVAGPMFGHRERPTAEGVAREREQAILDEAGVPREAFERAGGEAEGARRPYRVPVLDASVRALDGESIELTFALPSGSYATRVIAEITKTDVDLPGDD